MNFNWEFGNGEHLPEGYTVLARFDLPIYKGQYFMWCHLTIKIFWFFSISRKVAVEAY